jgi:hypothetical protein
MLTMAWLFVLSLIVFALSLMVFPWLTASPSFDRLSGLFFLNYISIVMISYGIGRYLQPLQFLMLFMTAYVLIQYFEGLLKRFKKKE